MNRSRKSGFAVSSSLNSSTTISRVGSAGRSAPSARRLVVVAQGGEGAGRAEQFHPAVQLAVDGVLHPVDQSELVGQVGDHRRGVRQRVELVEGRAALEVDQDEVQVVGWVGDGQAEHQGAQQLGLARSGGADHQAVRAHPALGGLLDVQLDGLTGGADADRHPQPIPRRAGPPGRAGRQRPDVRDADQVGQPGGGGQRLVGVRRRRGIRMAATARQVAAASPAADPVRGADVREHLLADPVDADPEDVVVGHPQPQRRAALGWSPSAPDRSMTVTPCSPWASASWLPSPTAPPSTITRMWLRSTSGSVVGDAHGRPANSSESSVLQPGQRARRR